MFRDQILQYFLMTETWEKVLATGYKPGVDREEAHANLDNSKEKVPGDTEFPTYDQLKSRRAKMKQSDRDYTQDYKEWKAHREGEK